MKFRTSFVLLALITAALACSAPGSSDTATPAVVTVMVTSDGSSITQPPAATDAQTAPQGISCKVVKDVRVHSCIGTGSGSVVGASPAGSTFAPTKWDGQNWFYGQVPTTGGNAWGWVSRLNTDGSALVECAGDTSALPKSYEPCPTAIPPTATNTPIPPTDTPQPTATNTPVPTAVLCGNGVADTGEECGEPVFLACPATRICRSCRCVLKLSILPTGVFVQP